MTTRNDDLGGLYDRLMAVNRDAVRVASFEAAYHALMAAMHCASELGDDDRLSEVARVANEQLAWIDAHAPGHRLASASASRRGHKSVYETAAMQADVLATMAQRRHKHGTADDRDRVGPES